MSFEPSQAFVSFVPFVVKNQSVLDNVANAPCQTSTSYSVARTDCIQEPKHSGSWQAHSLSPRAAAGIQSPSIRRA